MSMLPASTEWDWWSRLCQSQCRWKALVVCLTLLMPLLGHPAWGAHAEGDVLVARGVLAYHENRYDDAIDALSRAIAVTPDSVRAHYYLGLSYRERGQLDAAILALTRALEIDPNNADVRYQLGVTYLLASNYDQAHIHLESVFRERPNESLLAYYVGFLRFQKQDYTNAAKAFEVVQTEDPRLSQLVAFYRGMSLGYLGLSEQAIAQLEQVPRIDSTDIITGPTLRIRDVLATPANVQNRFRATLSVGGYYDDNVAVNPNASNDPIAQFLRERKTTSPGLLTSLQTEFSFLRKGPVEAALNYSFFQTVNLNDHLNDFNIQDHSGGLSTYYRGTFGTKHPYQVALQYTYGYLFLGEAGFLSRHIVSFSPTFVLPDFHLPLIGRVGNTTSPIALYQINNFFREVGDVDIRFGSDIRDGFNATGGLLHLFRFADDAFILRLGYRHDEENTKGSAFSYSGNRAIAGGQVTLPWGKITLRYDYDLHWRDYKYAQSLFPNEAGDLVPRYDMQKTHVVQLSKLIGTHWTATLQYQHLRNDSNIPVYNYTKNVFTALLSWTY